MHTFVVMLIGAFTGLLGGMFGKGGSAIATPLLAAAGVKPFAAIASPLPATIPATLIAALAYARANQIDKRILKLTIQAGVPATIVGALLTQLTGPSLLVVATEVVVAALGTKILFQATGSKRERELVSAAAVGGDRATFRDEVARDPTTVAVFATGAAVGLLSGLLGNSGGFLLAPIFATVLHLPIKRALGTSIAAAAALAIPGTIVHAAMGHIDWSVAIPFGMASIPLSATGARLALRAHAGRLEVLYGAALVILGGGLLLVR